MSTDGGIELNAGALRLALRPDLGGCIAGLWHHGLPVLRSTEPAALQATRQAAAYPLVPYSNRVAFRRFSWLGSDYTTLPNFDDSPHSLHGVGWTSAWRVTSAGASEAALALSHAGDAGWPFAFEAHQHFSVSPGAAAVRMVFTNTADVAQPVGLGWHPYFVRRAQSRLHIGITNRWDSDATGIPMQQVAQARIDGAVAGLAYDNCFDGWRGPARIDDEEFELKLTSSMNHLVVYTPVDKRYFCVEPVSHVSDAIHMADPAAHGLRSIEPGESIDVTMTIEVATR